MVLRPRVSTIPPGVPFVDSLAIGLTRRYGGAPDALARLTLLLPTRRACLAMRDAFLRHSGGAALLLPRLMPLGDMDADEIEPGLGEGLPESLAPESLAEDEAEPLPAAISGLERQLILTRLILARDSAEDAIRRADQAARLAAELAHLLDQAQTEQLSFEGLKALAPEDYAEHWQRTLEFLDIVTSHWPAILAERQLIDPAMHILAQRAQAIPNSAISEHDLESECLRTSRAIAKHIGATGIRRKIAANLATALRGKTQRKESIDVLRGFLDARERATSLGHERKVLCR